MFHRSLNIPRNRSCFLFGARGTGKSTLLREIFRPEATLNYNLLEAETEDRLSRDPGVLEREVLALGRETTHVVVDEVQKIPRLLNAVHNLLETHQLPQSFILIGSSARKLKSGSTNLLAGRASLRHLFPLSRRELGDAFDLDRALAFGGLPEIWNLSTDADRGDFLRAYAHGYLREEIRAEQVVRRLDPFRRFLEVAAQGSGKIVNYARIARDTQSDPKSVQAWYEVLEDTLMGFHVDGYHGSVRKQLHVAPKFYLFDLGVTRAMARLLNVAPQPGTSYYGELFEHLVVTELFARSFYEDLDWQFSYLLTKGGAEVDLVLRRPGRPLALVEIKSTREIREEHAAGLSAFLEDFPDADCFLLSQDPRPQKLGRIQALPWDLGILAI
jgi:predicted AAA+ superfamily ATPase